MVTRTWLSILVMTSPVLLWANIGIIFADNKVGVIYVESATVFYKSCTEPFTGTISSRCAHDPKSVLKADLDSYVKRVSMMTRIEERYSAWASVDVISAELEQTLRDIDSGILSESSLEKARREKNRLETVLEKWRDNTKRYWNYLLGLKEQPEENLLLNRQYRETEVEDLLGSFRPVWSEGKHVYMMAPSRITVQTMLRNFNPCPSGWEVASQRVLEAMLGDSPIYTWLGFSDLNPNYNPKEKIMGGAVEVLAKPPYRTYLMGNRPRVPPLGGLNETWMSPQASYEYRVVCVR